MYRSVIKKISLFFPRLFRVLFVNRVFIKFFLTGLLTLSSDLLFLFIFYKIASLPLVVSTSLAFIISFLINFYFHKFWTFRDDNREVYIQLLKYFLLAFVNLLINAKLMHLMVYRFNIFYLLSQAISASVLGIENFLIFNHFIFKKKIKLNKFKKINKFKSNKLHEIKG
ncbi:MAG: GtrA family protein [Patescibacteria group bacterium]|nr:GtrA family protein [Patescibacteria group bacterium]